MRILIATETYPPNVNGAALATHRLATELNSHRNEVFVIAPSTSFKDFKRKEEKITVYRLKSILIQKVSDFRMSPPLNFRRIRKIIKEVQPDIIHINNPGFTAQTAMSIGHELNIPVIGTSHFMPENLIHYLHLPNPIEKLVNSFMWKQYARFFGNLDLIISPTQTAADLLRQSGAESKIIVISNGIDLARFKPDNDSEYLKRRYNLPKKTTLLFVGRLDKEKNLDVFIKALGLLDKKIDYHVVIVGKGAEEPYLRDLAYEQGVSSNITFTGYLQDADLPNIYKVADIFIMPGIAELQSLVTMEAMACGLAVIAANAVALPHLVHDGKNGYLFKPGDERDFADKLQKMLKDKNMVKDMSRASLRIIKEHDIHNIINQTEQAYKEVIEDFKKEHKKLAVIEKKETSMTKLKNLKIARIIKESLKD